MELKDWGIIAFIAVVVIVITLGARHTPSTQLAAKGFDGKVPTVMKFDSKGNIQSNSYGDRDKTKINH